MVFAQKQKYRSAEQHIKLRNNLHTYGQLVYNNKARKYSGEKIVSPKSGARKTRQPHVRE